MFRLCNLDAGLCSAAFCLALFGEDLSWSRLWVEGLLRIAQALHPPRQPLGCAVCGTTKAMSVWANGSSTCFGDAGWAGGALLLGLMLLVVLLFGAAALGARWSREQIGLRFDRRIAAVYELIRAKAEAARAADYAEVPAEAFALYHALRDQLFELASVGASVQALKDAVVRAAAQPSTAPAGGGAVPVKGAMMVTRLPPPDSFPPEAAVPDPHAALRRAVDDFWEYWSNRPRIERQLRQAARNLGGEGVIREPPPRRRAWAKLSPAGSPPRAPSPARPRSRPASP
jgi:hypothetical protein